MTWKEFKDAAEQGGIRDEHEIWFIDVGSDYKSHELTVRVDPLNGARIFPSSPGEVAQKTT